VVLNDLKKKLTVSVGKPFMKLRVWKQFLVVDIQIVSKLIVGHGYNIIIDVLQFSKTTVARLNICLLLVLHLIWYDNNNY